MPSAADTYRRIVPPALRRVLTGAMRRAAWTAGMLALRARRGTVPSDRTLELLRFGWGNPLYSSRTTYLREVARRCGTGTGPIVEAGSGLTTVLVAHLAGDRRFVALEHLPEWARRVGRRLPRGAAPLRVAPLRDHGDFEWYELTEPPPVEIELLVCDGPPGSAKGGRYGGLAVLRSHMAAGGVILLDDADREGERAVLRRWERDFGWRARIVGRGAEAYAIVCRPGPD